MQIAVAVGGLVPVSAGLTGILLGSRMSGQGLDVSLDSHFHYLSGLLLGIGVAFWTTIPEIETKTARFQLLSAIVITGGIARLYALMMEGVPNRGMLFGLGMELVIMPALAIWQARIARHAKT